MNIKTKTLQTLFPNITGKALSQEIETMMYDSRHHLPNSLFVPIIGEKHDAHNYIEQAIQNGAVATFWAEKHSIPEHLLDQCLFFIVQDTVAALQKLANYYRNAINPIVIAVTGSNGKTTTKDLISAVLKTKYRVHQTEGNLNNHIGMPMTILQMPHDTEILVLEMGMSNFGEIALLSNIAEPDYAVITNIGESHIEFLGSREGIAQAKLEITTGLKKTDGVLFADGDEPLLKAVDETIRVIRCSFHDSQSEYRIADVNVATGKTLFRVNNEFYQIPLLGAHHAKNATFAIMLGEQLGLTTKMIQEGLTNIKQTGMRFEILTGKNGVTIVNDAYNASPTSMKAALEVVKQMSQYTKKIAVLGDILELGSRASVFHQEVAASIDDSFHVVFTYGKAASIISEYVQQHYPQIKSEHFTTYDAVAQALQPYLDEDTIILFKGSRGMALENIIAKLRAKE